MYNVVFTTDQLESVKRCWSRFKPEKLVEVMKQRLQQYRGSQSTHFVVEFKRKLDIINIKKYQNEQLLKKFNLVLLNLIDAWIETKELKDRMKGIQLVTKQQIATGSFGKVYVGSYGSKTVAIKVITKLVGEIRRSALWECFTLTYANLLICIYILIVRLIIPIC